MDAVVGQLVHGRYKLSRHLGSGGFGQVWSAEDMVLGVQVAVKEVRLGHVLPEQRGELLVRAAREARHAAKLRDHPNIVTVHDVVEVNGAPWIVMQLVEGHSLADEIKANGPLSEARASAIAQALLRALQFAHAAGIIHRDVKPANVMLTPHGDVLLTDFGIAVDHTDTRLTATNLVIGTPGYTAPERWQGAPASGPSDLYSLGVTLYEAVEGGLPFPRENPFAALEETPRIAQRADRLAPLLAALLQREPARRPTPAEALALLSAAPAVLKEPQQHKADARQAQTTLTIGQEKMIAQWVQRRILPSLGTGLLIAVGVGVSDKGPALFKFDDPFGSHILAGSIAYVVAAGIMLLKAVYEGRRFQSDIVVVSPDGFSVTRHDSGKKQSFTIGWRAVDRIGLGSSTHASEPHTDVRVWFKKGSEPSPAWLTKHDIKKQDDGSYRVYCADHVPFVPAERLHSALRTFAGPLYDDPHHTSDPA
ncbi:Serine/threonine-protein kinase PrkC [Streptomyces hundungensis]|uniref:non-specific serine/threonine protein kinase n=1 Tax=Streptomyces hundungensis TaxID=1077946 RepID=A0A387H774_9ACTN|nr:serine/threonine-protein kinase [Streptomyces hundungensis]AYG78023.1 Serine/threonine-protein kinase PrkC [Streptomyces hundungensis]